MRLTFLFIYLLTINHHLISYSLQGEINDHDPYIYNTLGYPNELLVLTVVNS